MAARTLRTALFQCLALSTRLWPDLHGGAQCHATSALQRWCRTEPATRHELALNERAGGHRGGTSDVTTVKPPQFVMDSSTGLSQFLPCVVSKAGDEVELKFSSGDVYSVYLPILRRSSVLKELEEADGQTVQLDAQHIQHWLNYVERGRYYLDVEELVDALKVCWD